MTHNINFADYGTYHIPAHLQPCVAIKLLTIFFEHIFTFFRLNQIFRQFFFSLHPKKKKSFDFISPPPFILAVSFERFCYIKFFFL